MFATLDPAKCQLWRNSFEFFEISLFLAILFWTFLWQLCFDCTLDVKPIFEVHCPFLWIWILVDFSLALLYKDYLKTFPRICSVHIFEKYRWLHQKLNHLNYMISTFNKLYEIKTFLRGWNNVAHGIIHNSIHKIACVAPLFFFRLELEERTLWMPNINWQLSA